MDALISCFLSTSLAMPLRHLFLEWDVHSLLPRTGHTINKGVNKAKCLQVSLGREHSLMWTRLEEVKGK